MVHTKHYMKCNLELKKKPFNKVKMTDKQKVLIIRLSSLGDVIFNIPLANVLKQNNYEVSWLVGEKGLDVIQNNPCVDKVFFAPVEKWKKNKNTRKKCKVEFILSNPCFEAWLLFYFIPHPKVEQSSQKVKEQLKKYVPQYSESFDIVKECNLEEKYAVAINRADLKNMTYSSDNILDKNPYTEIPELLDILLSFNNNEKEG